MSTTLQSYKRLQEASAGKLDQMLGWVIYGMESTNHDHDKLKKAFTKQFGAAATKKHWDDLVSQTMGD
tara:strand:- start:2826 stop:3029 length:204 start_codon:yes stop_codon:yes gene_type:complete